MVTRTKIKSCVSGRPDTLSIGRWMRDLDPFAPAGWNGRIAPAADHHLPRDGALELRTATPGDIPEVAELLEDALGAKYRPAYGRRSRAAIAAVMRAELAAGGNGYLVAAHDGTVVGAAHLTTPPSEALIDWIGTIRAEIGLMRTLRADLMLSSLAHGPLMPGEGYVGEVAVSPHARRRGVARALMSEVARRAADAGCTHLSLWVARENDAAQALYSGLGFTRVSDRRLWGTGRLFGSRGLVLMHRDL